MQLFRGRSASVASSGPADRPAELLLDEAAIAAQAAGKKALLASAGLSAIPAALLQAHSLTGMSIVGHFSFLLLTLLILSQRSISTLTGCRPCLPNCWLCPP